jgi:uncharacterized protein YjbJ (UPF0337 family)
VTNDPNLEISGDAEKKAGKVRQWIGRAEKAVGNNNVFNTGSQNTQEETRRLCHKR